MPNELYIGWLKDWTDKAFEVQSKGYQTLRRAHESMRSCPIELGHPSNAAQLKYIGPILCARLEKRLREHCAETGTSMPERPNTKRTNDGEDEAARESLATRKKPKVKTYVPAFRGGAYAILMALSDPAARENMPKSDLIRLAQPHCDSSFEVASDTRGYYTAWTSMKTLIDKELVHKSGNPPKYNMTDTGAEIADKIRATSDPMHVRCQEASGAMELESAVERQISGPRSGNRDSTEDMTGALPVDIEADFEPIILPAGTFKLQLIIDNREVKTQKDRSFIEDQLEAASIDLNARSLDVGDALWIAKARDGREVVLDQIVERKRMDDLVHSIKDGRFHEQKFRLQKCGARQIIYVIEESNMQDVLGYQEAINTALSSTQVVNGFFVKRVQSLDYTMRYLIRLTKKLQAVYESQDLFVIPDHMVDARNFAAMKARLKQKFPERQYYLNYAAFAGLTVKSMSLRIGDLWLRMLMSIRGVSSEKAIEIQAHYPTLQALLKAYDECPDMASKDKLIHKACVGYGRKAIGAALSKKIAAIFQ